MRARIWNTSFRNFGNDTFEALKYTKKYLLVIQSNRLNLSTPKKYKREDKTAKNIIHLYSSSSLK